MKANKPMTGEQLDELMTVAVNMQRDAETDCNRPSAMFAYAVQVAVLELRKVRNDASALAAENAGLKVANAESCKWDGEQWVGISIETPATDAFLAEMRAQGVEMAAQSEQFSTWVQQGLRGFAIGVRQGGEQ
ncbi:hypothetical protein L8O47_02430 [Enterobacter roggenkampii]|uniref:hypothetical protein n=1 Tax=Enterobacter roggenkampii TaxID=1812935 RepID=UPI00200492E4|nr:hypothetical protein [Enterobacter roggenkampii]MCK7149779.1 hypothetical protein [Enterobacter roggenkampii]